jgi:hypothetical protein
MSMTSTSLRVFNAGTGEIELEAGNWGVKPGTARYLFFLPVVACGLLVLTLLYRPLFDSLTAEDGIIEWLQFTGFAVGAVAGAIAAFKLRPDHRFASVAFTLFALGCLFIAGEEIAWGQRILGLETPDALASINHQNEITLHNITKGFSMQFMFNMFVLVIGFVGAIVPWVARRRKLFAGTDQALLVPALFLTSAFLMAGGYRLARLLPLPGKFVIVRYGEITELCLAFGLAVFAVLTVRRIQRGALPEESKPL